MIAVLEGGYFCVGVFELVPEFVYFGFVVVLGGVVDDVFFILAGFK